MVLERGIEMLLFIGLLLAGLAVFIFVLGFKFRQGKWLNLIAGNTFDDHHKEAEGIAPYIGMLMYVVSIFILMVVGLTVYFGY